MKSPFIYNNPLTNSYFFNREKIIKDILDYTFRGHDLGNIWLYGERQVGKTTILKYLEHLNNNNNFITCTGKYVKFIYFDCQSIQKKDDTLNEITSKIALDLNLVNNFKTEKLFTSVFRKVIEKNLYLVLLLDEFDSLLSYYDIKDKISSANIIKNIRSNLNGIQKLRGQPKLMSAVFSSNDKYKIITDPFKCIGSPLNCLEIELDWFTKFEIYELIKKYLPNEYALFNDKDIAFCFKQSHGHPMLVQKSLEVLYKFKKNGTKINKSEIEKEINNFISRTNAIWLNIKLPQKIKSELEKLGKNFKFKFGVNLGVVSLDMENK